MTPKNDRLIQAGEVWGIKMNQNPDAPWYDICLILGISESSGNCVVLSVMSGVFISDFTHDGLPSEDSMEGWERIV